MSFNVIETTIEQIHATYKSGSLTCRQLVQAYLDRIGTYDKSGPALNAIITINSHALQEADRLDAAFKASGFVGPMHGIPIMIKDQGDAVGMPTTLGSVLFKDYYPDRDAFVVEKLKKAGAIILAKATLGEFGGGDTHGSLFGSTKNPYDLERTAGGSSGGCGASVSANFCTVAVGQEGFASIRRPSTWNCLAGMRPTAGLVSRSGVYAGWPSVNGSLGPMARSVTDLARLLDVMVGYDPDDPVTAWGVGQISGSFTRFLDANALKGARIGILRESIGYDAEPGSNDFNKIAELFDKAVTDLKAVGAEIVNPVVIPDLRSLLAKRATNLMAEEESFNTWMKRSQKPPFSSRQQVMSSPEFQKVNKRSRDRWSKVSTDEAHYEYLKAREQLMSNFLQVMAKQRLDAIVHKSVEHQPTLITDGVNPPFVDLKGAPHINTFLVFVPSVVVPAGFTPDNLPGGITFLGRPYDDGNMIRFAYAYEQATHHRKPPPSVTPL